MILTESRLEGAMKLGKMNAVVETQDFALEIVWNDIRVAGTHKSLNFFEHSHSFTELYYVLRGEAELTAGGKHFVLSQGDCMVIPTGMTHRIIKASDDFCRYDIGFRVKRGEALINALSKIRGIPATVKITEATEHAIAYMLDSASGTQAFAQSCVDAMITCCIIELFRQFIPLPDAAGKSNTADKSNALAYRIVEYIHDNYTSGLTAGSVATEFHLSSRQIARILKSYDNTSVAELILTHRIDAARDLLSNSRLSVDEISQRVGYANEYTFIRAFHRCLGVTPGQFRKNN